MELRWVEREIPVEADVAWRLLTDVARWPEWGPSVRSAGLDSEHFEQGATGWVRTAIGIRLPFEVTSFDDGCRWSWKVAGLTATDHRVRPLDSTTCSVGFGVPRIGMPYAVVCRRALSTIDRLLTA